MKNIKFQIEAVKTNIDIFEYIQYDYKDMNDPKFNELLSSLLNNTTKDIINYTSRIDENILLSIMNSINFNKSVLFYKPIYYHFLDGYINQNEGSNLEPFVAKFHNELTLNETNIKISVKLIDSDILEDDFRINPNIYYIFQTSQDNHATSLLLFIKNDKYYILSFNSGLGINNHIRNMGKYIPYMINIIYYLLILV